MTSDGQTGAYIGSAITPDDAANASAAASSSKMRMSPGASRRSSASNGHSTRQEAPKSDSIAAASEPLKIVSPGMASFLPEVEASRSAQGRAHSPVSAAVFSADASLLEKFIPTGMPATHGVPKRCRRSSAVVIPQEETTRLTWAADARRMSSSVLPITIQETSSKPDSFSHSTMDSTVPLMEKSSGVAPMMFADGASVRGNLSVQNLDTTASSASDAPAR